MQILICDSCKCQETIHYGEHSMEFGWARNGECSPGYGSRYDCDSEHYAVNLPDGNYCYKCLDTAIDRTREENVFDPTTTNEYFIGLVAEVHRQGYGPEMWFQMTVEMVDWLHKYHG